MAIPPDPHYIPAFSIEDVLLDKDTGAPLTGGIVTFYRDSQRLQLKPVYQITGTSPNYTFIQLPNPMTLSAIGTFQDAMDNPVIPYFFPYTTDLDADLYYITVESSGLVPQFTREAQPYIPSGGGTVVGGTVTNELSNPQFSEVLFDTEAANYTFTFGSVTNHEVEIAPDWRIKVTAPVSGTVTVSQVKPLGALNIPTNPGTLLQISSSAGITSLQLIQRIVGSPNLWGNGFLSGGFLAKVYGGTSKILTLLYSQSNGTIVDKPIVSATLDGSGQYEYFPGSTQIDLSDSGQAFPDAYIDIFFNLPLGVMLDISSVMAVATATNVDNVGYDQESNPRQIDHLFHYYKPQLAFKPIPSLLTGWDFPLNPAQILATATNLSSSGSTQTMTTTAKYLWDQTIGQSVVGNVAVVRNTVTGGFQATTANPAEAFYIMQYLSSWEAQEILGNRLAVNLNAFRTNAGGTTTARVYLYRGSSSAVFPALPLTIGGATPLAASGVFTKNSTAAQGLNWTLIARGELGQAYGTIPVLDTGDYSSLNDIVDLNFQGWEITDSTEISDTNKFCIVVTFQCPTTGTVVIVDSCSLMKGDIATRPGAKSMAETLTDCQRYYEIGYNNSPGMAIAVPSSNTAQAFVTGFGISFSTEKRATPNIRVFNGFSGLVDTIDTPLYFAIPGDLVGTTGPTATAVGFWKQNPSAKGVLFEPQLAVSATPVASTVSASGTSFYASSLSALNYVADARLGIV